MEHVFSFTRFVTERFQYNDTLNPEFWKDGKFDENVREKLMAMAEDFHRDLKTGAPMMDVRLTGSMANYTWSKHSDLDVHVVIDFSEIDDNEGLVRTALDGQRFVWNLRHPVVIMGHDVELYMQDDDEKHTSSGVYSLMHSKWVVEPKYDPPDVDADYVDSKVDSFEREIDEITKALSGEDPDDPKRVLDRVGVLKGKIMKARQAGLDRDGEYSIENLVFKQLRQSGWIEKLMDLGARAYSAIYSDETQGIRKTMGDLAENQVTEMKKHVKNISEFVSEAISYDEATKAALAAQMNDLRALGELNLVSPETIENKRQEILKGSRDRRALMEDPILGPIITSPVFQATKTPAFQRLEEMGYKVMSDYRQLINGTIALGTETSGKYRIGVFKSGYIRRWGVGAREAKVVSKPGGIGQVFYENAFRWIAEHVDVTSPYLLTHKARKSSKEKASHGLPLNRKLGWE